MFHVKYPHTFTSDNTLENKTVLCSLFLFSSRETNDTKNKVFGTFIHNFVSVSVLCLWFENTVHYIGWVQISDPTFFPIMRILNTFIVHSSNIKAGVTKLRLANGRKWQKKNPLAENGLKA